MMAATLVIAVGLAGTAAAQRFRGGGGRFMPVVANPPYTGTFTT